MKHKYQSGRKTAGASLKRMRSRRSLVWREDDTGLPDVVPDDVEFASWQMWGGDKKTTRQAAGPIPDTEPSVEYYDNAMGFDEDEDNYFDTVAVTSDRVAFRNMREDEDLTVALYDRESRELVGQYNTEDFFDFYNIVASDDGEVFVTGGTFQNRVIAVDKDANMLWDMELPDTDDWSDLCYPTVTSENELIVVGEDDGNGSSRAFKIALDDGTVLENNLITEAGVPSYNNTMSLHEDDGYVYFSTDNEEVVKLQLDDLSYVDSVTVSDIEHGIIYVEDVGIVPFAGWEDGTGLVDIDTMEVQWTLDHEDFDNEVAYLNWVYDKSEDIIMSPERDGEAIVGVDPNDGEILYEETTDYDNDWNNSYSGICSPDTGVAAFTEHAHRDRVYGFDTATGEQEWMVDSIETLVSYGLAYEPTKPSLAGMAYTTEPWHGVIELVW